MESLISAGLLLIKRSPRPGWSEESLLPGQIISASDCICLQFPGPYATAWSSESEDDSNEEFEKVGLRPERRSRAGAWATEQCGRVFGWPTVFYAREGAMAAQSAFFLDDAQAQMIGLGLPEECAESFLGSAAPPAQLPDSAPWGECGHYEITKQRRPLSSGGSVLGFELVNVEVGQFAHSWLCNHLEKHCAEVLGIRPGPNGLLPDLESAKRCCNEISKDEVGAEPGPWFPWALVRYG